MLDYDERTGIWFSGIHVKYKSGVTMTDFVNVATFDSAAERAANVPGVKASILIDAPLHPQPFRPTVVKYGGSAMINAELRSSIMDDLTLLKLIGMNPVVVTAADGN